MDNIIEVKNLSFAYPTYDDQTVSFIENFNLNIERGSFIAILGHNGSGKSTLAKLFNGLLIPDSGQVLVGGLDTKDEKNDMEIRRTVGLVFQNPDNQLVSSIVEEDVAFGPENLGVPRDELRVRVDESLKAVNMYEYKNHEPHKLSGGQKQRIAIAGIIAMRPDCIVLDEPTAMLDPRGRKEVIEIVKRLNADLGKTVVLITHYMDEAAMTDRVVVMDGGVIIADDTPKNIFSQVDMLHEVGLDVPQPTELIYELNKEGLGFDSHILTVDECVNALAKQILGD